MTTAAKPAKTSTHRFVEEMQAGEQISDDVFLVVQKDLRTTTNGSLYIHLVLADRTGQILGRIWSATQSMYEQISEGSFVRVRGRVESYKGNAQFIVEGLRPADPAQIELADFLPRTRHDIEEMWNRVVAILRTVKNPHLLALVKHFVKDEQIVAAFQRAPAAIHNHHAYLGGLLEHTLSVLELAVRLLGRNDASDSHYPEVSRDLVLVGVFLHDIGKAAELCYETNFAYTNSGQLVGHITQAAIWIDQKAAAVEQEAGHPFPADLQSVLTHIVLAHHGAYEFGSPKLPACPEAFLVHYLDNIDAKVHMCLTAMNAAKNADSDWSDYIKALETRVFRKDVMGIRDGSSGRG